MLHWTLFPREYFMKPLMGQIRISESLKALLYLDPSTPDRVGKRTHIKVVRANPADPSPESQQAASLGTLDQPDSSILTACNAAHSG